MSGIAPEIEDQMSTTEINPDLIEHRLTSLEGGVDEIRTSVRSIDRKLGSIELLESHHEQTRAAIGRAFSHIDEHNKRLHEVEADLPMLRVTSAWVRAGVVGSVSILAMILVTLALAGQHIATSGGGIAASVARTIAPQRH